jgi:hypothetical protein
VPKVAKLAYCRILFVIYYACICSDDEGILFGNEREINHGQEFSAAL